ncbi:protein trichome birefringence-like 19 [Typha angustifolia]|uniref:protein trichome birefringence-like 19 n=1 Tax=Typha angustifolia TaxID=59011 RepID=UPI003C2FCDCC
MKSYSISDYLENTPKVVIILTLTLVLLTIAPLYSLLLASPWRSPSPSPPPSLHNDVNDMLRGIRNPKNCNIFCGEWVPNPGAPYYTNETCSVIHEHQNCMKFGRPDTDFMKWRWKPDECELPIFNPAQFLELVRGKSLAFLGDSVGRNQMQSLMCLLSKVTYAVDASKIPNDQSTRFFYPTHNFTLANFWSPYLVRGVNADPNGPIFTSLFNLYLDEPDPTWTSQIAAFDYVIVSAGHWFFRPTMFYEASRLVGCLNCLDPAVPDLTVSYSYRSAFRTTFRYLIDLRGYKGTTILRTFAPSHFEDGDWDKGGDCVRRRPFRRNETRLEGIDLELYAAQMEEYRRAEREGREKGVRFRLLDTTGAMLLRPDGHPSRYGQAAWKKVGMPNDCVHWCLPGPIDAWNDFLLEILKMETG